jgi:hypothetical protein
MAFMFEPDWSLIILLDHLTLLEAFNGVLCKK